MLPVRPPTITALAVVTLLALSACAPAAPIPAPAPTTSGGALPAGLPRGIPIAAGRIVDSSASGGEWRVWVRSTDVVRDYRAARKRLVAAGPHITVDNVFPGSGQGQFCDARYCVDLDAYDDPVHGASLGYEVYRNSGLGPIA